jgi:CHAT domain-containing protein
LLAGGRDTPRRAALEREIAELSREWRETATSIRQTSPAWASLTEPEPLTSADVQRLLDTDTVLLAYAPGDTHDWLFAVTREGVDSVALPSRTIVDAAAREVHTLLTARQPVRGESAARRRVRVRRADARLAERARALSRLVLGPIAARLTDEWRGKRLAIVANGALEYVPFAMLPIDMEGAETPLIARHEVVSLPSASTLALLRQEYARRPRASGSVAVIADPVFSADDPRVLRARRAPAPPDRPGETTTPALAPAATRALEAFTRDGTRGPLARLPFSRAEARAVASQAARGAVLQATDFDASLSLATGGRLDGYRIVHFATHGLIDTRRPELSGLALSLVDASGRPRDGFLRLNTIYNLRLSADLVVLSACQTALGREVAGEGLVGLTRGFMHAGTPRVIATLWQVNDAATAELMRRFYTNLLRRGLPASTALRRAQLEISRDPRWSVPYYWAAFVLQGDWAP